MAINLKEIFDYDSDQIKLDKVNYNFDQLEANGGGPQGPAGQKGAQGTGGATGFQGDVGPQGDQGNQGPTGSDGGEYWTQLNGNTQGLLSDTLVPTHDPAQSQESPNVVIGYKTSDPEYNMGEEESKLVVHRHNNFESNIRLTTAGVSNAFDFILSESSSTSVLTMRFTGGSPNLLSQYADRIKLLSNDGNTQYAEFNGTDLTVSVDADFQNTVINGTMQIATGNPDVDKVAVASDLQGTVEFKSISEIGGTVPVGTIISILPSIFTDNTKFVNQETIVLTDNDNDILPIRAGSGKGDYEGWYICNGKTWKDGNGFTFDTPDLNSFSYTIDDNASSVDSNSQGSASVTNNEVQIIGGSDIDLEADNIYTNTYNVSATVDSTSVNLQAGTGTTNVKIKKLPQIIYIGEADLYWEDAGSGQAPIVTNTYNFLNTANSSTQSFLVQDNQGDSGQFLVELYAPSGQKWDSIPQFGDPNGISLPNISQGPPVMIDSNPQIINVYMQQIADGNTYQFVYNSSGNISANSATYNLTADNGVSITSTNPLTINGNNGSSAAIGVVTFEAPNGSSFASINDIIAPSGYTISNATLINSNTIQAGLSVDSFVTGSFNVNFGSNLQVDLSNTTLSISGIGALTQSNTTLDLSAGWNSTNFNSSTMDYRVYYSLMDNQVTPTSWTLWTTTDNISYQDLISGLPIDDSGFAYVKVEIVETGNISNIGASDISFAPYDLSVI